MSTETRQGDKPTETEQHSTQTVPEYDKYGRYTGHDYVACSCGAEAMRERDLPCEGGA